MQVALLEICYRLILALCKLHIQVCHAKLNFQAGSKITNLSKITDMLDLL